MRVERCKAPVPLMLCSASDNTEPTAGSAVMVDERLGSLALSILERRMSLGSGACKLERREPRDVLSTLERREPLGDS